MAFLVHYVGGLKLWLLVLGLFGSLKFFRKQSLLTFFSPRFFRYLSILIVVFGVLILAFSSSIPWYGEHGSPMLTTGGLQVLSGQPVYQDLAGANRQITFYGPAIFLYNAVLDSLYLPNPVMASHFGVFSWILGFVLFAFALRQIRGRHAYDFLWEMGAFFFFSYFFLGQLGGDNRAEALIFLGFCLALWACVQRSTLLFLTAFSLGVGMALGTKIYVLFIAMPLYYLAMTYQGPRKACLGVILAGCMAIVPFILMPTCFSFLHYGQMLSLAVTQVHGLSLLRVGYYFLMVWLLFNFPLLLARKEFSRWDWVVLGVTVFFSAWFSSKPGSAIVQYMPLIPVVYFFYYARLGETEVKPDSFSLWRLFWMSSTVILFGCSVFLSLVPACQQWAVSRDIQGILRTYPSARISMGYSHTNESGQYSRTFLRPLLFRTSHDLFIDMPSLMDLQFAGKSPISAATLQKLGAGFYDIFLIPKGCPPFVSENFYDHFSGQSRPLFSAEFLQVFYDHYEVKNSTDYFDVWVKKS